VKAIVCTEYGPPDVLQLKEVEKPTPKENQVLVKVYAASVNAGDWRGMRANPFLVRLMGGGFLRPKDPRFGSDVAGRVEAVGENVKQFRPGDEVFVCAAGAFAEYALAREAYLALKPTNRSFEEAAAVPVAALTALQGLRDTGGIRARAGGFDPRRLGRCGYVCSTACKVVRGGSHRRVQHAESRPGALAWGRPRH